MNNEEIFPVFEKSIKDLIEDQEGNIPSGKLLMLGSMIVILGTLLSQEVLAAHRSHSSHRSHQSHRSHSSGSYHNSHSSHSSGTRTFAHTNHGSHDSHVSHQSHTSHSNTASHSNSLYSAEGDVQYSAPAASTVPSIAAAPQVNDTSSTFALPDVNQMIEMPNGTPGTAFVPSLAVPLPTPATDIDTSLKVPAATKDIIE